MLQGLGHSEVFSFGGQSVVGAIETSEQKRDVTQHGFGEALSGGCRGNRL